MPSLPKLAFFCFFVVGCSSNFPGEMYFVNPCMYSFTSFFSCGAVISFI